MDNQKIIFSSDFKDSLSNFLNDGMKVLLFTGNNSFKYFEKNKSILEIFSKTKFIHLSNFSVNPKKDELDFLSLKAKNFNPDLIVAIGGGSVIDMAKNFIYQEEIDVFEFIVIPTTCGSGSESTNFAVLYENGIKKSNVSNRLLPKKIIYDTWFISSVNIKVLWASVLDSLFQSIESLWAVSSNIESQKYAEKSIKNIVLGISDINKIEFRKLYIGSCFSGKAINISKTTAPHALSYPLTYSLNIPHGYAVGYTLPSVIKYNLGRLDNERRHFLERIYFRLFNVNTISDFLDKLISLIKLFDFKYPKIESELIEELVLGVNTERMNNNPVKFENLDIKEIYKNSNKIFYEPI